MAPLALALRSIQVFRDASGVCHRVALVGLPGSSLCVSLPLDQEVARLDPDLVREADRLLAASPRRRRSA